MKTIYLLLLTFNITFAINNDLEKPDISSEFTQLNRLETLAIQKQDVESISKSNPEILKNIRLDSSSSIFRKEKRDLPLGIPAIVWGICCCIFGVGLVYLHTDNDMEQVKKALIGCAIYMVVNMIFYVVTANSGTSSF